MNQNNFSNQGIGNEEEGGEENNNNIISITKKMAHECSTN